MSPLVTKTTSSAHIATSTTNSATTVTSAHLATKEKRVEERKAPPVEETKKRVEKEETEKENRKMRWVVRCSYVG